MRRALSVAACFAVFLSVAAPTSLPMVLPENFKGIKAIIVYGRELKEPIRIGDVEIATWIYTEMVRAFSHGEQYPAEKLKDRRCIGVAVFLPSRRWELIPVDMLPIEQANFTYWFYPQADLEPAVIMGSRRMPPALIDQLAEYGVPKRLPAKANAIACGLRPTEF